MSIIINLYIIISALFLTTTHVVGLADKAIIADAASGAVTPVEAGETKRALEYEMRDMEEAVQSGDVSRMQMPFTGDVMNIMTDLRKNWGLVYPEESGKTE